MRLDRVTAVIRPRSDWEALDLGLAMVRRDFWRCLAVWWLAVLGPTVAVVWWLWDSPGWWLLWFWWWKPAGSRLVLFELSRRLFGELPAWGASLRQIPRAWTRRFWYRFGWARLSPWLPVLLAVEDLEGLSGQAYRQRCRQLTRRGEGVVMWVYAMADVAACGFGLAILVLALMFIPEGQDGAWHQAMDSWDLSDPASLPLLILRAVSGCVMLAMSLTDVFVTGAGFGIYLNNRTWLEGWDVELAFKRLAGRLTKVVLLGLGWWALGQPDVAHAGELIGDGRRPPLQGSISDGHRPPLQAHATAEREPARWIREVKADETFKVHTVIDKVPQASTHGWSWQLPEWLRLGGPAWLGSVFTAAAVALMLGAIGWLLWHTRQVWRHRGAGAAKAPPPAARVVLGMPVAPESLPEDVPGAAWALWRQDRPQEALGLLYRGTISRVIQVGRVAIEESDTEGDCLRRVEQAGAAAYPEYFRGLTGVWSRLAYAGLCPEEREIEALCQQWPFMDRRDG